MNDNIFEFNGVTYMVTSSIRLNNESDNLYNFSLAILNPKNRRKQFSLNCLSLKQKLDRQGKPYLALHSPMHKFFGGQCASTVCLPDKHDNIQNEDRKVFLETVLLPILSKVADDSLKFIKRRK